LGESVQKRREEGILPTQLALQHRDLVAEGEDLRILGLVAHQQRPPAGSLPALPPERSAHRAELADVRAFRSRA
jgi:hypothetical protein